MMNENWKDIIIASIIFVAVLAIGGLYIMQSQYGYTESAILYLTGVLAAGLFWVGRK